MKNESKKKSIKNIRKKHPVKKFSTIASYVRHEDFDMLRKFLFENRRFLDQHIHTFSEYQKAQALMWTCIENKLTAISTSLDKHILDEAKTWKSFGTQVDDIKSTLSDITENGTRGMHEGLEKIQSKIDNLEVLTGEIRHKQNLRKAIAEWSRDKGFIKFGKTKIGFIIYILITFIAINTILRAFDIEIDVQSFFKLLTNNVIGR